MLSMGKNRNSVAGTNLNLLKKSGKAKGLPFLTGMDNNRSLFKSV